jgi:hypothetical protein
MPFFLLFLQFHDFFEVSQNGRSMQGFFQITSHKN